MQRTTRVQNTAEITLRRLSATVTAAIILLDCQVRRGLPYKISPLSDCQRSFALMCRDGEKSNQRHLQMVQGKVDVEAGCPGAAVIIIMSCRGVHQPSVYGCCDAKSEVVEILALYCRKSSRFGLMSNCNFKQFRASVQCPLSSIK